MTKTLFLFTLFILSCFSGSCQSDQDIQTWIQLQLENRQWSFSSRDNSKFRPGWMRQIEFRTETDRFDIERQEYVFRVNPSTPSIRRAQSNLIEAGAKEGVLLTDDINKEIKESIIRDLFEIVSLIRKDHLNAILLEVYKDQETLAKKMLQNAPSKIKDLIQIEEDIQQLHLDQYESAARIKELSGNSITPKLNEICDLETLKNRVQTFLFKEFESKRNPSYEFEKGKLNAEKNLEIAEKQRVLDFVQLRYNGPHSDLFQEKMALGIAFQLPFSSGKKMRLEELRIEKILLEQKHQADLFLDSLEMENDLKTIFRMFDFREYANANIMDVYDKYSDAIVKSNKTTLDSPDLILFLKAQSIKNDIKLLDQEFDIYEKYIDLLRNTNIFSLTNFWQPFVK